MGKKKRKPSKYRVIIGRAVMEDPDEEKSQYVVKIGRAVIEKPEPIVRYRVKIGKAVLEDTPGHKVEGEPESVRKKKLYGGSPPTKGFPKKIYPDVDGDV